MRTRWVFLIMTVGCLSGCATLNEKADLYGIQMKNVRSSQNFHLKSDATDGFSYTYRQGVMDNDVYAYGHFGYIQYPPNKISNLRITLINESKAPIAIDYNFASFTLGTQDGQKHEIKSWITFYPANHAIAPKGRMIFSFSLGELKLNAKDVKMLTCSFGLDETIVVLLPKG